MDEVFLLLFVRKKEGAYWVLDDRRPTINHDGLPGDVSARVTGEEKGEALEVVERADFVHWDALGHFGDAGVIDMGGHFGGEPARRNGVDVDAVFAPLGAEGSGHADNGGFGGLVGDRAWPRDAGLEAGDRGDVDDFAFFLRDHPGAGDALREVEHRIDVEAEDAAPVILGVVLGGGAPGGAGVVEQDIDAAALRHHGVAEDLRTGGVAQIGRHGDNLDALGAHAFGGFIERCLFTRGDDDGGTIFAKRLCCLQAKSARSAGDEGDPPG